MVSAYRHMHRHADMLDKGFLPLIPSFNTKTQIYMNIFFVILCLHFLSLSFPFLLCCTCCIFLCLYVTIPLIVSFCQQPLNYIILLLLILSLLYLIYVLCISTSTMLLSSSDCLRDTKPFARQLTITTRLVKQR